MREFLKKLMLILGSLFIVIIILEISLRLYLKEDYSVPSHRDWKFHKIWDAKFEKLNSLGHRDHEFSVKKPDNVYRILVIGDSFTYGEGIKQIDDIYTEILEKKLNETQNELQYEVLNLAKRGMNVKEYLTLLIDIGLRYEPDMAVISFYINDIEPKEIKSKRQKKHGGKSLHWMLSRISYLYFYSSYRYDGWKNRGDYANHYLRYTSKDSYGWKRFVPLWNEIINLCNTNTIKPVVMILPHLSMLNDNHQHIELYDNVEKISKEAGADAINIFPALKGHNPSDLWIGITNSHPNEKAHQIFASELNEFINDKNLVP